MRKAYGFPSSLCSRGKWGSGSGKTKARPKATGLITEIYALILYLNEKSFIERKVAGARGNNEKLSCEFLPQVTF